MVTRRDFIKNSTIAAAGFVLTPRGWLIKDATAQTPLLDAASHPKFLHPVPHPSRITHKRPGKKMKSEITKKKQFLGLYNANGEALKTKVWGYEFEGKKTLSKGAKAIFPGPTIIAQRDKALLIKWKNELKRSLLPTDMSLHMARPRKGIPIVTHLHGGHTEPASDGEPEAWFTEDFKETGPTFVKKTYRYDNDQEAGTLWYHDHALGLTRLNVYAGLAGFYLLRDDHEKKLIDNNVVPSDRHEKELVIQDRMFTADGQLFFPSENPEREPVNPLTGEPFPPLPPGPSIIAEFFGDFIQVNGVVWPTLDVEPRKYRFRVLSGSDSRFYFLKFENNMSFMQIGVDQGMFPEPIKTNEMLLAPSERVDIVVDFTGMEGQEIKLQNFGPDAPFKGFDAMGNVIGGSADPATTGQIMKFRVNQPYDNDVTEASIDMGTSLRPVAPAPVQTGATRQLVLFEGLDEYGRLQPLLGTLNEGSQAWFDPITENPGLNDVEVWEIYNTTEDGHPIHIHLIAFEILNRESFTGEVVQKPQLMHNGHYGVGGKLLADTIVLGNDVRDPDPGEKGRKDTVIANPGEVTRIITTPFDRSGRYVWHCHILSHEDHEMMRPYHVG